MSSASIAPHFCLGTGVLKCSAGHSTSAVNKRQCWRRIYICLYVFFYFFFVIFFCCCCSFLQYVTNFLQQKGKTKQITKSKKQKIFLIDKVTNSGVYTKFSSEIAKSTGGFRYLVTCPQLEQAPLIYR